MWVVPGRREEVWTLLLLLLLLEVEVMEEGSGRDGSFQLPPLRLSVSVGQEDKELSNQTITMNFIYFRLINK